MNIPWIDLTIQHSVLHSEINAAIQGVLDRGDFILGQDVRMLEEEFAAYCGTKYAVGVDNGVSALELSLRAFGIGAGDEVIVPAHTFTATAAAVTFTGATPIFIDVDTVTWNIDAGAVEPAITPRTRAILPVHLYGLPAEMDEIHRIASKHRLVIIEDACQAHGAEYAGQHTGSLGDAAGFSFYPTKNLGACGDGGMVTTSDASVAESIRALRNCGQRIKNIHELNPSNHRLDSLQAAILRVKLRHLDEWVALRRQWAALYGILLAETHLILPAEPSGRKHAYHLYAIRTPHRDALQARLKTLGIGTSIHYPKPVHLQPFYAQGRDRHGEFPVAEQICDEILSLPMYPEMSKEQVEAVATAVMSASVIA